MASGVRFFFALTFSFCVALTLRSAARSAPGSGSGSGSGAKAVHASGDKSSPAPARAVAKVISITRAVGEVNDRIVTSREVRISEAIEAVFADALTDGAPPRPGFRPVILSGSEKDFFRAVARVLDEWAVYFEARSLSESTGSRAEIGQLQEAVYKKWADHPDWRAMEPAPDEVREIIHRKLVAKDFERLKSDPSLVPVTDDEALAYYKRNRLKFGSLPFASFKENIKAYLTKQQMERRLTEWYEVLRRKYKIRNFIAG